MLRRRRIYTIFTTVVVFAIIIWCGTNLYIIPNESIAVFSEEIVGKNHRVFENGVLTQHRTSNTKHLTKWRRIAEEINIDDRIKYGHREGNLETRYPGAIVIGSSKCGSAALRYFLSEHPDIAFLTEITELHIFNRKYFTEKTLDDYRKKMAYSFADQITMEKSPLTIVQKQAPQLIKQYFPDVKMIVVTRDPVKRTISDFVQQIDYNIQLNKPPRWDRRDFPKVVFNNDKTVKENLDIIRRSNYDVLMENWFQTFNKSQFLILDGELLVTNPSQVLQEVEKFLGVSHFFKKEHFYFDDGKGFMCISVPAPHCLPKGKGRAHPDIPDNLIDILYNYYKPHVRNLFQKTGLNFTWPRYY